MPVGSPIGIVTNRFVALADSFISTLNDLTFDFDCSCVNHRAISFTSGGAAERKTDRLWNGMGQG
jgi:hypothetical protein